MPQSVPELSLLPIAYVHSCYTSNFGVPRQSGLVSGAKARLVFLPEFRSPEAVRGLGTFSHIWLIWQFHLHRTQGWHPTVRPPRLGGNARMGVFATRSPFRPNPVGLSAVRLDKVELSPTEGPVLHLSGVDLADGTPVLDIKPYLPLADSIPDASSGFAAAPIPRLRVDFLCAVDPYLSAEEKAALEDTLAMDPRPPYQDEPDRLYGMTFAGWDVLFSVNADSVAVLSIRKPS